MTVAIPARLANRTFETIKEATGRCIGEELVQDALTEPGGRDDKQREEESRGIEDKELSVRNQGREIRTNEDSGLRTVNRGQ